MRRLRDAGVPMGLGLDHPNHTHDFFQTMKTTVLAQRQFEGDGSAWGAEDALDLATRGGAAALRLDAEIGSLEKGKQADLVVLDHRHPDLQPPAGALRLVVQAASPATVRHVMAGGRWLLRERRLQLLDEEAITAAATSAQRRVLAAAGLPPFTSPWS